MNGLNQSIKATHLSVSEGIHSRSSSDPNIPDTISPCATEEANSMQSGPISSTARSPVQPCVSICAAEMQVAVRLFVGVFDVAKPPLVLFISCTLR